MIDTNKFKRSVKEWIRTNPDGTMEDLVDFCEGLIPAPQQASYAWLVEQTAGWYDHVLTSRRSSRFFAPDDEEV